MVTALIVADGDVSAGTLSHPLLAAHADDLLIVAADGGAARAELLGLRPDIVVGDLDSLSPETVDRLRSDGVEVLQHRADKDESDTELALREAISRGARQLIIVGGLGGPRVDHSLANVLLLSLPQPDGCEVVLVDGPASLRVMGLAGQDTLTLDGLPGDLVSLLPLSERVEGVRSEGLVYALDDETLEQGPSRGLSNVMRAAQAIIRSRSGRLAVIHTPGQRAEVPHDD
ncbi:thiamine diphosphokinase [soil metagenome]